MKNQKGITLIALIVTIIVLIILAGISVNLLLGENGLIQRAKDAKVMQEKAELKEQMWLAITAKQVDGKGVVTQADVEAVLGTYGAVNKNTDGTIKGVTPTGKDYEIPFSEIYTGTIAEEAKTGLWLGEVKCSNYSPEEIMTIIKNTLEDPSFEEEGMGGSGSVLITREEGGNFSIILCIDPDFYVNKRNTTFCSTTMNVIIGDSNLVDTKILNVNCWKYTFFDSDNPDVRPIGIGDPNFYFDGEVVDILGMYEDTFKSINVETLKSLIEWTD